MFEPLHTLARVSISLPEELLVALDRLVTRRRLPSRSRAIAMMLNRYLGEQPAAASDRPIVGTITLLYRNDLPLQPHLTGMQQKLRTQLISCSILPLDAEQTMAVLFVQGAASQLKMMGEGLLALREVSYSNTQLPGQATAEVAAPQRVSEAGGAWALNSRPAAPTQADSPASG